MKIVEISGSRSQVVGLRQRLKNQSYKRSGAISVLMCVAAATMLLDATLNITSITFVMFGAFFISIVMLIRESKSRHRYKIAEVLFVVVSSLYIVNSFAEPASAQFFQGAEDWMTGQFSGSTGVGNAITLVFNVLRGLFLLYLGISLVKVIQAARQDEDWQNLARTPMIILIAVTIGDILASLITGGGSGTAGTGAGTGIRTGG